jgi:hypothetical protein
MDSFVNPVIEAIVSMSILFFFILQMMSLFLSSASALSFSALALSFSILALSLSACSFSAKAFSSTIVLNQSRQ